LKKFKITLLLYSGAWRKMIPEKKPEAKNLMTLSLERSPSVLLNPHHLLFNDF
jgi:hypothetical protein